MSFPVVLLSLLFLVACQSRPAATDDLDSWVRENAIAIPDLDFNLELPQLDFLDQALKGKRVVFLGEDAHWIHEKWDYRLIILKKILPLGFTNVGMEMGISDGRRIDDYLVSGDAANLDRVALYGYRSAVIKNRVKVGSCPMTTKANPNMGKLFKSEETWFFRQLRDMDTKILPNPERIHYFGFDVDTIPGGVYEDVPRTWSKYASNKNVAQVLKLLKPPDTESEQNESARLESVLRRLDTDKLQLQKVVGKESFSSVKLWVRTLTESIEFMEILNSKPCEKEKWKEWNGRLMQAMAARERMMFEIFRAKLDELGPDAKIVLMGHDLHLSKDPQSLFFTKVEIPKSYAVPMWPSIGQFITQTLELPTYSIWMIHAGGTQSNLNCPTDDCPVESGANYLGNQLARSGKLFLLPLAKANDKRAKALDQPLDFSVNGGTHSGRILNNADLIFFSEKVSGLKPRTSQFQ